MTYQKIKDINFDKILNKRYKNWKQFCEDNNINYNNSPKYAKSQKDELERFVKVKWIGRELIIKEIRENVIPSNSKIGKSGRFSDYLEYLLPFVPQDEYLSMNEILKELGLLNTKYLSYKYDNNKCLTQILHILDKPHFGTKEYNDKILIDIMKHFFRHSDFIKNNIKMKLETLERNNVINLTIKTMISDCDGCHMANISESDMIEDAENMVLELMGYSNFQEVYLKNEFDKFYTNVMRLLEEREMIIDYYYPVYKFSYFTKKKGRTPSETTIDKKKQDFKVEYIKKIHELINNQSSKKTIEHIENKSRGYITREDVVSYEHAICDFLLSNKPLREIQN